MSPHEPEASLAAAYPLDRERIERLDIESLEAELLGDLDDEELAPPPVTAERPRRRRLPRRALALGAVTLAALVVGVALLLGRASHQPSRAYGAELVRFAESTPLLLLEGPGWRVADLHQSPTREGAQGSIEFVTGKAIPPETMNGPTVEVERGGQVVGVAPGTPESVRQRKVELAWSHHSLAEAVGSGPAGARAPRGRWRRAPVLGTSALIDTRAAVYATHNGPGRQMVGYWSEDGLLLELRASVPDLAAFEERLDWVTKVDSRTWLEAMPAKVVKAANLEGTERRMLRGIPLPKSFAFSLIPDEGLTTSHDQVAGTVTNTVACLWFRQWGAARASGDAAAKAEAEKALGTYRRWPILRREAMRGGEYPETLVKLVASMPSGVWQFGPHRYRLLPKAEGLGCARLGIPVLPWKQKRRRERGGSPLPR